MADESARIKELESALEGLLEVVDLALDHLVLPLLETAVGYKHSVSTQHTERARQQGIADAMRQVRIWLEDNEGVHRLADARALLS